VAITLQVADLQHVAVGVSGPDGANRMFITTGRVTTNQTAVSNTTTKENYSIHVEPLLSASQFRRAIASVAFAELELSDYNAQYDGVRWRIDDVDADFDDELGRVGLRFTIEVRTTGTASARVGPVSFTVTTLARV
jgi:hypothetical protein